MITNEKNNAVVSVPIGRDGLLGAKGSRTATGGAGANGIDGAKNKPAAPDPLFSQSSLTVAGNVWHAKNPHLYAVANTGRHSTSLPSTQSPIRYPCLPSTPKIPPSSP